MSGGSFNYLYSRIENETYSLLYMAGELEDMSRYLLSEGKGEAAKELWEYAQKIKEVEPNGFILEIIKAVEWWVSNDIGSENFDEEWEKYKRAKKLL